MDTDIDLDRSADVPPDSVPPAPRPASAGLSFHALGTVGQYLLIFAVSGWLILIGNLFPIASNTGFIFPEVADLGGLIASILLLAVMALTPFAVRNIFWVKKEPQA